MATSVAARDLERLSQLYASGFYDAFIDKALHRIVQRQIERDEADLQQMDRELAVFEKLNGLTSDEFWQRYQAGQMADTADFMEWNVLCKARQRIAARLRILRGAGAHD